MVTNQQALKNEIKLLKLETRQADGLSSNHDDGGIRLIEQTNLPEKAVPGSGTGVAPSVCWGLGVERTTILVEVARVEGRRVAEALTGVDLIIILVRWG